MNDVYQDMLSAHYYNHAIILMLLEYYEVAGHENSGFHIALI